MAGGNPKLNLLFDENLGIPIARAVFEVLKFDKSVDVYAEYMVDWIRAGCKDDEWVPKAKSEGKFVITGDKGKRRDGAPLDLLLPFHGVSACYFTGGLQARKQIEKARALIHVWPELVKRVAKDKQGTRYSLRMNGTSYSLTEWPLNEAAKARQVKELGRFPETLWEARHAGP